MFQDGLSKFSITKLLIKSNPSKSLNVKSIALKETNMRFLGCRTEFEEPRREEGQNVRSQAC